MPELTHKEKHKLLVAAGWRFERFSKSKQRWVPRKSYSRQMMRALEWAWAQYERKQKHMNKFMPLRLAALMLALLVVFWIGSYRNDILDPLFYLALGWLARSIQLPKIGLQEPLRKEN